MKILKKIGKIILIFITFFALIKIALFLYVKISPDLEIKNANSFTLYDSNNNIFFQGSESNEWISIKNISPFLINATIAVEDKNFYKHSGFDYLRIGRALFENIKEKTIVQGASTISQQYAKNLFLNFSQTWKRKWDEMWITIKLEGTYTKNEILEGYLNTINYGHGNYGIESASKYYFNKSSNNLTLAEASILAGIPNSPANYSPLANYELSKKRQKTVLSRMLKNNYITDDEFNNAVNENLELYGKKNTLNLNTLMYFKDAVMDELDDIEQIPNSFLQTGGLKIYTTLETKAQESIENSINRNISNNNIQVAGTMINPNNGAVIALVGGKDYSKSQYNRAIYAKRQPGSTIKPILYYAALENGFTSSTSFISQKTTFNIENTSPYSPQNYGNVYGNKAISLATAIAYSDNIYAVKTHLFLGESALLNTAKRVGIKSNIEPVISSPLGSYEINMIELSLGYSSFANEGYKVEKHFINKVEDNQGKVLYKFKEKKEQILNPSLVFILNDLLSGTYDNNLIDYNYPTCVGIAPKLTKKYAIKSGTTTSDVWIIGYNKKVVLSLWSGYDNNDEVSNTDSKNNKNAWADAIESYLDSVDNNSWYEIPNNVVGILVDPITGTIANKNTKKQKVLYYLKGTEPQITNEAFDTLMEE